MADEANPQDGPKSGSNSQDDSIKNLKAELSRKLDAQVSNMEKTYQALAQKLDQISAATAPAAKKQSSTDELSDLLYDDPAAYARRIKEETEAAIEQKYQAQSQIKQKEAQVLNRLITDYPELSNTSNELTQKAVEIYNSFSDDDKRNPTTYRTAVLEAAQELGIKPMSKRSSDDMDGYSISSSSGNSTKRTRKAQSGQLEPETIEFARLMGLNPDDPETKKRLEKRAERKNWYKYE